MLNHWTCGVMDWLVMAFISGGGFAVFLLAMLMIVALLRYVFAGRFGGPA